MRAYQGRVFRLDRHLSRLAHSAGVLGISIEMKELERGVKDVIRANKLGDARVRITVSPGEGGMTPDPDTCQKPTVLIMAQSYQPYTAEVYENGFRATVSSIRRNSRSLLSSIKSTSYLDSMLARQEARKAGIEEAICLNEKGLLAEASMSNIFLVVDGGLKTPGLDSGVLPGITREAVLELAARLDIDTLEQDISLEELFQAEEAFLTNSLIEVMPLTQVDGNPVGSGKAGPITRKLSAAYKGLVLTEAENAQ